jgi:hypothetical protein
MMASNYSVSGEGVVAVATGAAKINFSKIEKVSPLNFVGDGQYVILINNENGYDLLGGKGIISYDDLDTAIEVKEVFCQKIANMLGEITVAELGIGVYLVQKGVDEYGFDVIAVVECVA